MNKDEKRDLRDGDLNDVAGGQWDLSTGICPKNVSVPDAAQSFNNCRPCEHFSFTFKSEFKNGPLSKASYFYNTRCAYFERNATMTTTTKLH